MSRFKVGDRVTKENTAKIGTVIEISTQCDDECVVKWRDGVIENYADHEIEGPYVSKAVRGLYDTKNDLNVIRAALEMLVCHAPVMSVELDDSLDQAMIALERLEKRS